MPTKRKYPTKTCPRCDGDGEEVGAPVELDGKWLCSRCKGKGYISLTKKEFEKLQGKPDGQ